MHNDSYEAVENFEQTYLKSPCNVLDVGSRNENGTYKDIFRNHTYTGIDIEPGDNVDIVTEPYRMVHTLDCKRFDAVVCGNVIEHVEDLHEFFADLRMTIQIDGYVIILTPTKIHEHRYPIDCWRLMPDGLRYLMNQAQLEIISIENIGGLHDDLVCVGRRAFT